MSEVAIARRYAQALMGLAEREKQIDAVGEGLSALSAGLQASAKSRGFLTNPKLSRGQKAQVFDKLFADGALKDMPALVKTFVKLLAQKGRVSLLADIQVAYLALADARQGRAHAEITVAKPLSSDQKSEIQKQYERLSGKKLTLTETVDPTLLGGAITKIGSTVRDGSLRNQLRQIRSSIILGKVEAQ